MENLDSLYGKYVFNDTVMRSRLSKTAYTIMKRTINTAMPLDSTIADEVASAMKEWAMEKGATHYTHWFQPMSGATAEKHDAFISPAGDGRAIFEFSGKELIKGEPDASSFPSGGLRNTFEARGYTAWDCTSPAFVKEGTLFIPSVFFSYAGQVLDKKAPLLRSLEVLNHHASRVLRALGHTSAQKTTVAIGPEQEYFLVNRDAYNKRLDLILTGRTLFGSKALKGQEMEDQYFGRLRMTVNEFMHDLDHELWSLGIAAKTKHNETAPAQHELAVVYDQATIAADHNLLVMEMIRKVAKKHGFAALLHEKPFEGINGSGKHVNWSITDDNGDNLFKPGKRPAENKQFLLFLSAVIKAVDEYADLLRVSVASAGNDHRLGGHGAPPAIISVYTGTELETIIHSIIHGECYQKNVRECTNLGIDSMPQITRDSNDRNRTSPFAFTGNKFEFRMCGSQSNVSQPCYILNTIVAKVLSEFADVLEQAEDVEATVCQLTKDTFTAHSRIIFNGNNYSQEWIEEAKRRGLPCFNSTVDAIGALLKEKNKQVFIDMNVLSEAEIEARYEILLNNYAKTINLEAVTLADITERQLLPAIYEYISSISDTAAKSGCQSASKRRDHLITLADRADNALSVLKEEIASAMTEDSYTTAKNYHDKVLSAMDALRQIIDQAESVMPASVWPVPVYTDLLFKVQ